MSNLLTLGLVLAQIALLVLWFTTYTTLPAWMVFAPGIVLLGLWVLNFGPLAFALFGALLVAAFSGRRGW